MKFSPLRSIELRPATHCHRCLIFTAAAALAAQFAWGAPASDVLLPAATKGFVSVAQPTESKERFQQIQIGQLLDDETMEPFVESMRQQLKDKFGTVTDRLGITWDDLDGVPAGELSLAIIERPNQDAALAITIDVTGHDSQAARLLAAVSERLAARGGNKQTAKVADTELSIFNLPAAADKKKPIQTVYFIRDNVLCGINGRDQAEAMLKRFSGTPRDNLRSVVAYEKSMDRCRRAAGRMEPEVRWFVEPFGYIWASRTLNESRRSRYEKDVPKTLSEQGFDAIQGAGGFVNMLAPGQVDLLCRMAVYAPPVEGRQNDPLRWNLAMRMLQLPNSPGLAPQSWAPRMSARYSSYSIDVLNAFDHVDSLFDALQGHEDAFKTSMEGIEKDQYGPQVNIRNEFISHMGRRVTLLTDYSTPISVKSERSVCAIESADEAKLAATLAKIMEKEPDVERREFREYVIWERIPANVAVRELTIDAPGFSPLHDEEEALPDEEQDRERVLPNSAVCVALGQLFMASDIDFLKELLAGFGQREMLVSSGDYQQVMTAIERLAPGPKSGVTFSRTDEAYRPTYELIRQGRMPEAETILGKLFNRMLTTEVEKEEGVLRKQRVDGGQLPSFERVRRYFGPAATALRSDEDGWMVTAAVLHKEAP
jgi:hypothetical protein